MTFGSIIQPHGRKNRNDMRRTERRKTFGKSVKTWFSAIFPAIMACLLCVLASPDAICADNDEFLISLPDDIVKEKTPSADPKTKNPRPNEMLQGVIYDLKRNKDGSSSGIKPESESPSLYGEPFITAVKPFVLGRWTQKQGADGVTRYPDLDKYFCVPTRLGNTYFYLDEVDSTEAPKYLHSENVMNPGAWVGIWSGYVVAPFTGNFRFVGFGDDQLLVRFNRKIVLDYGWSIATLGLRLDRAADLLSMLSKSSRSASDPYFSQIRDSPLYNSHRLEMLPVFCGSNQEFGLQRGPVQSVQKGQVIPIEIYMSEVGGGGFSTSLFVEQLDKDGYPLKRDPKKLPLFRTTAHLPPHPTSGKIPDFEDNGPIWKVVDSRGRPVSSSSLAGLNVKPGLRLDNRTASNQQTKTTETTVGTDHASETATNGSAPAQSGRDDSSKIKLLQGVFYDLKQLRNRQANSDFLEAQTAGSDSSSKTAPALNILRSFVNGNWTKAYDKDGRLHYTALDKYYCPTRRMWNSCFYIKTMPSESMLSALNCREEVNPGAWVCVFSGYVVAPFDGKFRFLGCADDALVVRFDQQIVLDYGFVSLTLGKEISGPEDFLDTRKQQNPGILKPLLQKKENIYSGKPEVYYPSAFSNRGIAKGVPVNVSKGKAYLIEILFSDISNGNFNAALFIERMDSTGKPLNANPVKLPVFRTSSALPEHSTLSSFPDYDENSPIWKVVDSIGRTVPSRTQTASGAKQQTGGGKSAASNQEKTPASSQQKNDSKPKKTEPAASGTSSAKTASDSRTGSPAQTGKYNPFGYTRPPEEDE